MKRFALGLALVFAIAPAATFAGSEPTGTWRRLPPAPVAVNDARTSVWTGKEMLVVGRVTTRAKDGAVLERASVAAAYDPAVNTWRRLPAPGPNSSFMGYSAAWTGKEMLVWGQGIREAFNPRTNTWRQLPSSRLLAVHDGFGLVVWTGRELLGWGGGCCGDAFSDGVAYSPRTNTWRALRSSPLAGSQHPIGAWTGRELIVFVGGVDPNGKPWPARLARAAAYNPTTNTWRRIAPLPVSPAGATAVWDGREVLVVGGTVGLAYNARTNAWRKLPRTDSSRFGAATVWTGKRLLVWGGSKTAGAGPPVIPAHGLAYDPRANRWSPLPEAPLLGRLDPTAVWTGHEMIVWGGDRPAMPLGSGTRFFNDAAAFRPAS
jgi:N-acetylneuraminic acid mutarotase